MVPSAHQPTPAQQSPSALQNRPVAPYIPEANPDAPKSPEQAFAERSRAAIDSRLAGAQRAGVADATEAPAAPAVKPAPVVDAAGAPAVAADAAVAEAPVAAPAAPVEASHRYDVKSVRSWAEKNPEEAARLGKAVFGVDPGEGFIKLQNRARKVKAEIDEKHTKSAATLKEHADKVASDLAAAETIAGQVRWLGDMWSAASKKGEDGKHTPDFDMIDEAFKQNTGGLSVDDYVRLRARRGVSNPEQAKLRAQVARQEQELAALRGQTKGAADSTPAAPAGQTAGAAAGAPPPVAAPVAPASSAAAEAIWGEEIPKAHQLREFSGWAAELDKEMRRYHDETLDEYSVDAEEIANALLQRKLAAFVPAAPAAKPTATKGKPNTPRNRASVPLGDGIPSAADLTPRNGSKPVARAPGNHSEGTEEDIYDPGGDAPKDFSKRNRWALDRAMRRARGEVFE